jgi:hypothetical protein
MYIARKLVQQYRVVAAAAAAQNKAESIRVDESSPAHTWLHDLMVVQAQGSQSHLCDDLLARSHPTPLSRASQGNQ